MLTATKRAFKTFLITAFTVAFLAFAVSNREIVHLSLFPLPYTADMPQFLFAIMCFAMGTIVGWMSIKLKLSKSTRLFKSEHKRVMALQNEVGALNAEQGKPVSLPNT